MTPEALQEALKPHRMTKFLADASGYSADYLTLLKQGKHKMRESTAKNLAEALPRAQQLWQAQYHARYYHGKPCVTCGSTMRYTTTKKCVPCVRRIWAARRAAMTPQTALASCSGGAV